MKAPVVVLPLPFAELPGELLPGLEVRAAVELVLVGAMAPLDLAVGLGTSWGNPLVGDPQVMEMPREVGAELGPVVGLDPLNGHRECPPKLLDKVDRRLNRAVVVEFQDPESSGFIDGGELIQAPA
jgi:hypothetical protein